MELSKKRTNKNKKSEEKSELDIENKDKLNISDENSSIGSNKSEKHNSGLVSPKNTDEID